MAEGETQSLGPENERGLACLSYLFLWITGLIILLTAKKEEKYKRWHAIQAIGLGIAVTVLYIVLQIIFTGLLFTGGAGGFAVGAMIMLLLQLAIIVLVILMMVTAYQGKKIKIPVVAGFADKNA